MRFVNAREFDRKSGCTLGRTWGTRPEPKTVVARSIPPALTTFCCYRSLGGYGIWRELLRSIVAVHSAPGKPQEASAFNSFSTL
jgi:hypothetical protein